MNFEESKPKILRPSFTYQRVILKEPIKGIICCYQIYGMGTKQHFNYYKGNEIIKSIFATSYSESNIIFLKWWSELNMEKS